MMVIIVLFIAFLAACGGGTQKTEVVKIESILVIGDSLCSEGWPDLITVFTVKNSCISGAGLVRSFKDLVPVYEHEAGYYDHTIISLGVNDAVMNVDPVLFELAYTSLYDVASNPACVLPPLTNHANIQSIMMNYHRIIISICDKTIDAAPSDHKDGIHYTPETDLLMAQTIQNQLGS